MHIHITIYNGPHLGTYLTLKTKDFKKQRNYTNYHMIQIILVILITLLLIPAIVMVRAKTDSLSSSTTTTLSPALSLLSLILQKLKQYKDCVKITGSNYHETCALECIKKLCPRDLKIPDLFGQCAASTVNSY